MALCPHDGSRLTFTGMVHPDDLEECTCRQCRRIFWVNQGGGIDHEGENPPRRIGTAPAPHSSCSDDLQLAQGANETLTGTHHILGRPVTCPSCGHIFPLKDTL